MHAAGLNNSSKNHQGREAHTSYADPTQVRQRQDVDVDDEVHCNSIQVIITVRENK